jgi:signal transduction histidine kinase/CheY-like chemotaxis protein
MINSLFGLFAIALSVFSPCITNNKQPSNIVRNADVTIKVGYIDYKKMVDVTTEDGVLTYSGYGVDYMNKVSALTGWKFEYVYDTWENQIGGTDSVAYADSNISTGKIDMVIQAQKTADREANYDFSTIELGNESSAVYTLNENDIYFDDYAYIHKIGLLNGSFQTQAFNNYMTNVKGIDPSNFTLYADYSSYTDMKNDLTSGKLDSIVTGSLSYEDGLKMVGKFDTTPFYAMFSKTFKYKDAFNKALDDISTDYPTFQSSLVSKYYGKSIYGSSPNFTREEHNLIVNKNGTSLSLALIPNRKPISYLDNDKPTGILVDLMDAVAKVSGLTFSYSFLAAGQKTLDYLSSNKDSWVVGVDVNNKNFDRTEVVVTDQILDCNVVMATKHGKVISLNEPFSVGLPKSYASLASYLKANYPLITIKATYSTTEDCLKAVQNGEIDAMFQNLYVLSPFLSSPYYEDLTIIPTIIMDESLGLVTNRSDETALLGSIINKTIATISAVDVSQVVINYTVLNAYKMGFWDFLYKNRAAVITVVVLVLLLIASLIFIIIGNKHNHKKLEEKNEQLRDLVLEANSANNAKSAFLSRMSHEIRTPINAIVGLSDLGTSHCEALDETSLNYFEKIKSSSLILLGLVNDVLDMSAIEANKIKINYTRVDLKDLINSITSVYYPLCNSKGINFEIHSNMTHEIVQSDSLRLSQILLNLISNAYKFTSKGGNVTLNIKENNYDGQKAIYVFEVCDTGEGMSEEMLSRLFKPFEQESSSTASTHGGSGLGLSIAKNLVDLMQGNIVATSKKGEGTNFTVTFNFEVIEEESSKENESFNQSIKALVVDDEQDSLLYTGEVLKRIGVQYDTASNKKEVLEKIEEAKKNNKPYDVCFLDWKMPDTDGISLTKAIRKEFNKKSLIIILSAYDLGEISSQAKEAGVDHIITKPLFQSSVFNILMELSHGQLVKRVSSPKSYNFKGKRILIVEDNAINLEVATEILKMTGAEVDVAENGKLSIEKIKGNPDGYYDAVLMDIQMPVMNGYEASKAIRKLPLPYVKTLHIYAMTANAFDEDVTKCIASGMNGHVAEPIDTNKLFETLDKGFKEDKKKA